MSSSPITTYINNKQQVENKQDHRHVAYMLSTGGKHVKRREGWYSGLHEVDWEGLLSIDDYVLFNRVRVDITGIRMPLPVCIMCDMDCRLDLKALGLEADAKKIANFVVRDLNMAIDYGLDSVVDWLVLEQNVPWTEEAVVKLLKSPWPGSIDLWREHLPLMKQVLPRFDSSLGCSTLRAREALEYGAEVDLTWLAHREDWRTLQMALKSDTRPEDLPSHIFCHLLLHDKSHPVAGTFGPVTFRVVDRDVTLCQEDMPAKLRYVLYGYVWPGEVQDLFVQFRLTTDYDDLALSYRDKNKWEKLRPTTRAECAWYFARGFNVDTRSLYYCGMSKEIFKQGAFQDLVKCINGVCVRCEPCGCPDWMTLCPHDCSFFKNKRAYRRLVLALIDDGTEREAQQLFKYRSTFAGSEELIGRRFGFDVADFTKALKPMLELKPVFDKL